MNITNAEESGRRAAAGAWGAIERHCIDGATVAVTRHGAGIPVVCLHAIAHGARDFEPLAQRVADVCEVLAIDWPGHGRSGAPTAPASAASYAQVLDELLPRIATEPVVLLGCSIGGAAALQIAARRPERVRALVLCNSGGLLAVDRFTRFATARLHRFFAAGARGAWWYPRAFALYYRLVLQRAAAGPQRHRIVDAAYETAAPLAEAWASFGEAAADLRGLIPRILQPTFFAWAKGDLILPWARHRDVARSFGDVRIELFRGGHAAFLEDPDRFAVRLREFLAALPARGPEDVLCP